MIEPFGHLLLGQRNRCIRLVGCGLRGETVDSELFELPERLERLDSSVFGNHILVRRMKQLSPQVLFGCIFTK